MNVVAAAGKTVGKVKTNNNTHTFTPTLPLTPS